MHSHCFGWMFPPLLVAVRCGGFFSLCSSFLFTSLYPVYKNEQMRSRSSPSFFSEIYVLFLFTLSILANLALFTIWKPDRTQKKGLPHHHNCCIPTHTNISVYTENSARIFRRTTLNAAINSMPQNKRNIFGILQAESSDYFCSCVRFVYEWFIHLWCGRKNTQTRAHSHNNQIFALTFAHVWYALGQFAYFLSTISQWRITYKQSVEFLSATDIPHALITTYQWVKHRYVCFAYRIKFTLRHHCQSETLFGYIIWAENLSANYEVESSENSIYEWWRRRHNSHIYQIIRNSLVI